MSSPVQRLRDVRMADLGQVGGKAASLGELLAAGVRVPDGIVLAARIAEVPASERRDVVLTATDGLGPGPFAVRSSGIAEDGMEQSHAGMYDSLLDVALEDLPAATERCLASVHSARAAAYEPGRGAAMAVIIQQMVTAAAAGVALTADPITGDRASCVVSAVRGSGERLVSGVAVGDEWLVGPDGATPRRRPEGAIDRDQAVRVAAEARRIADSRGTPQDIEWAIDEAGTLWILQARPMTGVPPVVSWDPGHRGAYLRSIRFGEWISEPVTPLFESWLLTTMEERLHLRLREWIGQHAPPPYHVVVNGWYFYSVNFISGAAIARTLPDLLWHAVRYPRRVAGLFPPTNRYSVPLFEREWREDLLPRYRSAVSAAEARVETTPVIDLPALIDELAVLAGDYFASIAALAGSAYKMEVPLARFCRRHLADVLDGGHLPLLAGFAPPTDPGRHAVVSLDWWHAPVPDATAPKSDADHDRIIEARANAEQLACEALAPTPRRLRTFLRLLAAAQHLVPLREEQVRELTIAWPVMRRAVLRMGQSLAGSGVIAQPDDVFFLTRAETLAALGGTALAASADPAIRRATRQEQGRLVPPLLIGRVNPAVRKMWDAFPRLVGATKSDTALVSGAPASPGRVSGLVRVIRGPHEFDRLQPGEVLVAPLTAPAWTPLFTLAAAVVTDVGSAASHASIIAREYGIPAVVGCGDATTRLHDGMHVTVDGRTGNVEPARPPAVSAEPVRSTAMGDGPDVGGTSRLELGKLLAAAEAAPPVAAVEVVGTLLADMIGAHDVGFLIADYSGDSLIRLGHSVRHGHGARSQETAERVPVRGTPHGRALSSQSVEVVSDSSGTWLYAPVTSRGEAVGVLELEVDSAPDERMVSDVAQAAHALAYIVIANRRYTDLFEWGKRSVPLSLAAEIQHRLLPGAYTCEGGQFTLAAWLEPAGDVGGDTFDFSLERDSLFFSITDAMGHTVQSSLLATLLVGSLRHGRRRGASLSEQARLADAALAEHARGSVFVTGQIVRVDLASGTAQVVNAGHPPPLRLRQSVVDEVPLKADPPFGAVAESEFGVQTLPLHPGDRLMFLTDGVLERKAAAVDVRDVLASSREQHPREAEQNLIRAAVKASGGQLEDDATALCFDWHGGEPGDRVTVAGADVP